ncbi:T9SS type A sorting domain-containing protein [bacterium]|nr:T9SS type A sorting domain-containing protein [bacterium]
MKNITIYFLLLLSAILPAQANPIIYCNNSLDESLGWCDLADHSSNSTAVTLGNIPNDVLVMGNFLYVVNSGYNNLQEVDRLTLETVREIPLAGCVNPYALTKVDDQHLAVTGLISNTLSIVELPSGSIIATRIFGLGLQAVTTHGNRIYVLSTGFSWPNYGEGYLFALDASSYVILDSLFIGTNPQGIAFDSQGRAHIACTGDYADIQGSVVILDPLQRVTIASLPLGGTPASLSLGDGFAFVPAGGWADDGYIYRYRLSDLVVMNNSSNPILCGSGASDIIALPNNEFVVSCFMDATLEHRSSAGELIRTYLMSAGAGAIDAWFGTSDASEQSPSVAESRDLLRAYPNPFNSSTTIALTGAANGNRLGVYNLLGQRVADLAVQPGQAEAKWSPASMGGTELSGGVYLINSDEPSRYDPILLYYLK